jgi:hypothetical protein
MTRFRALSAAILLSTAAVACSQPPPEPQVASSATEPGYAQDYPAALQSISKDFGRDDDDAGRLDSGFGGYTKDLKSPDWKVVGEIVDRADAAGKSRQYVDRNAEVAGARAFFDAEGEEITKKVAGSATYAAKQKGCETDLSGVVGKSLSDAVTKRLEERLRERNEAHHVIDRNRVALGKENAAALEKDADEISRASYLVNIAMVEEKVRLRTLLTEAEQVKKTIDDFVAAERAFQGKSGRTDAEKKASDERIERAQKSKAEVDSAITQGQEIEKQMDERIQKAQKRHNDAINALKQDIQEKAKSYGQAS